jgi:putative flippase GtrA
LPHEMIRRLAWRVLRYGGVGLALSMIYSLAVIVAVRVTWLGPMMASVVAFAIVLPISWFGHGTISFGDRARDAFQPLRFVLSTSATFVVAVGGMYWITEIAGRSYLLGIAWNWLVIPATNFLVYMFFVFRNGRQLA